MLFHKKERAQGMVEYALLIVLLAVVCVLLITVMGDAVQTMYSRAAAAWPVP